MAFIIESDERQNWMYQAETTFGTPIAMSSTSFKGVVFEKGNLPRLGINKSNLMLNRASRVLALTDLYNDNYSGPFEIPFSCLLTIDRAADLLYAVTQNKVSEGLTGTGFSKVFRPHASQPDFTANAGWFGTFVWVPVGFPTASTISFTSCILKDLTLTFDKTSAGMSNIVKASGTILAKERSIDQNFTGTATAQGGSYYLAHQFTTMDLTVVGSGGETPYNPNWASLSVTVTNNAEPRDKDANGNPVTYFLNFSEGLKLSTTIWYDATSRDAIYSAVNGSVITLALTKGTVDTAGYFKIAAKGIITNDPPLVVESGEMRVPLDLQLGNTTAAGVDALDFTIADAIDQVP